MHQLLPDFGITPLLQYRMNKEEQESVSRPVGIFFIPEKIVLPFHQKLKIQIAFYRGNKVCKTKPNKYTKRSPDNVTHFDQQKLNFCTTITFIENLQSFQSKKIDVQLAFDADGKREELQARIDLKDILEFRKQFEKKNLSVSFKEQIKLFYRIQAKFSEGLPSLKNRLDAIRQQPSKERKQEKSAKKKGINFGPQIKQNENPKQKVDRKQRKAQTYTKPATSQIGTQQKYSEKLNPLSKSTKLADTETPTPEIQAQRQKILNSLKATIQSLEKKNERLELRMKQLEENFENKQNQIDELQSINKELMREKKELLSSKSDQKEAEKLIEKKNMQIRKLEDEISKHLLKQTEFHRKTESLIKNEQQMREKYQESERKNIKILEEASEKGYQIEKLKKQIANLHQSIDAMKKQHEEEIDDLESRLRKNSNLTQSSGNQGKDIERLKKDLQKKEQMIKILGESKQNAKNQAKHEYEMVKKENNELKEQLQQMKKSLKGGDGSDLQLKVANEKLKREFDQMKKMEKNMLMEKSSLKSQNQNMQLQLIKQKQTIAKMLNMIQEESQELFTMITDCIV